MATVIDGGGAVSQNITKFAWRMRFTLAERALLTEAAKTDSDIQATKEDFDSIPDARGVNPTSPKATEILNLFVSKGLLAAERVAIIQFTPVSPEEAVQ